MSQQYDKILKELAILSRLRNLEEIVTKKAKEMPITYDIKKDYLYNEGFKKGEKRGEKRGKKRGIEVGKNAMIIEMLKDKSLSVEKIAKFAKVSVDYVKQLQHSLNL